MRYKKKVITIGAFDLAKGMGMFCIVAGHTIFNYDVPFTAVSTGLKIFGTGLMPMFFLISGFGCKGAFDSVFFCNGCSGGSVSGPAFSYVSLVAGDLG